MRRRRQITDRTRAAMLSVPRPLFLPDDVRAYAAEDRPLPIGHGQTNSQPTTVAHMLSQLDPQPGDRVLDVGSGSGWTTALLAHLVGRQDLVYAVERVPELVELARTQLTAADFGQVTLEQAGPEVLGMPSRAPFDRILVSAEAPSLPDPLVQQLAAGGRLVIPVAGRVLVIDRLRSGKIRVRPLGRYAFVPLRWTGRGV